MQVVRKLVNDCSFKSFAWKLRAKCEISKLLTWLSLTWHYLTISIPFWLGSDQQFDIQSLSPGLGSSTFWSEYGRLYLDINLSCTGGAISASASQGSHEAFHTDYTLCQSHKLYRLSVLIFPLLRHYRLFPLSFPWLHHCKAALLYGDSCVSGFLCE